MLVNGCNVDGGCVVCFFLFMVDLGAAVNVFEN